MTKQFAAGQFLGKSSAVNGHKWFAFSLAAFMNLLGNGFFTTTAFSMNNYSIISGSNKINLLDQLLENSRIAKYIITGNNHIRFVPFQCNGCFVSLFDVVRC